VLWITSRCKLQLQSTKRKSRFWSRLNNRDGTSAPCRPKRNSPERAILQIPRRGLMYFCDAARGNCRSFGKQAIGQRKRSIGSDNAGIRYLRRITDERRLRGPSVFTKPNPTCTLCGHRNGLSRQRTNSHPAIYIHCEALII